MGVFSVTRLSWSAMLCLYGLPNEAKNNRGLWVRGDGRRGVFGTWTFWTHEARVKQAKRWKSSSHKFSLFVCLRFYLLPPYLIG